MQSGSVCVDPTCEFSSFHAIIDHHEGVGPSGKPSLAAVERSGRALVRVDPRFVVTCLIFWREPTIRPTELLGPDTPYARRYYPGQRQAWCYVEKERLFHW